MIKVFIGNVEYANHIQYAFSILLAGHEHVIAGPSDSPSGSDLAIYYGAKYDDQGNTPKIVVHYESRFWDNYLTSESMPLCTESMIIGDDDITKHLLDGSIVSLFGNGANSAVRIRRNSIFIESDIVASAFVCLTRYEEVLSESGDQFGRFKAASSIQYDYLHRPIVDEYSQLLHGSILRSSMVSCRPNQPRLRVTHDVDSLYQYFRSSNPLRSFLSLSLKHGQPMFAVKKEFIGICHKIGLIRQKPAIQSVYEYMKKFGYHADVFFITYGETKYERQYHIDEPDCLEVVDRLKSMGARVGIHPSTVTKLRLEKMKKEHGEFRDGVGFAPKISRQHKLMFKIPETYQILEKLSVEEDHSMAYSEVNGFRAGTCRPYRFFDCTAGKLLNLRIHPLIIMENVYMNVQRLSVTEALNDSFKLMNAVKYYGGELSILWHNTSFSGQYVSKWNKLYCDLIEECDAQGFLFL